MNQWLYFFTFAAIICTVVYLLYRRGIAVSKSIFAALFVFRSGRDRDRAALDACTGWVQHAGRFRESRTYEFIFDARLSRGSAQVFLLDGKKRRLLKLDRGSPSGRIELNGKSRYYLRWEFADAAGKCELRWYSQTT